MGGRPGARCGCMRRTAPSRAGTLITQSAHAQLVAPLAPPSRVGRQHHFQCAMKTWVMALRDTHSPPPRKTGRGVTARPWDAAEPEYPQPQPHAQNIAHVHGARRSHIRGLSSPRASSRPCELRCRWRFTRRCRSVGPPFGRAPRGPRASPDSQTRTSRTARRCWRAARRRWLCSGRACEVTCDLSAVAGYHLFILEVSKMTTLLVKRHFGRVSAAAARRLDSATANCHIYGTDGC